MAVAESASGLAGGGIIKLHHRAMFGLVLCVQARSPVGALAAVDVSVPLASGWTVVKYGREGGR